MILTAIDGFLLNEATNGFRVVVEKGSQYAANVSLRDRAGIDPAIDRVSLEAVERTLTVIPLENTTPDIEAFNQLVYQVFEMTPEPVLFEGTYDGVKYENYGQIISSGRSAVGWWQVQVLFVSPTWKAVSTQNAVESPIALTGNAVVRPVLYVQGAPVTRKRLIVEGGEAGLQAFPISFQQSGSNSTVVVFAGGIEQPFTISDGRLYMRVGCQAGEDVVIDVYQGASISSKKGGQFDAGGMALSSSISSGVFDLDPSCASDHPESASLVWVPGIITKHSDSREYTFGFDGDTLRLVDREATGTRWELNDNADAWVCTSPVPIASISNLNLTLSTGYRPGLRDADRGEARERVQRVILADIDGFPTQEPTYDPPSSSEGFQFGDGGSQFNWYLRWTFGDVTFPNTMVRRGVQLTSLDTVDLWYQVADFNDMVELIEEWIGCTVTTGEESGVFYLHFPPGAFAGAEIPLLTMQITGRGAEYVSGGDRDVVYPGMPRPIFLFQAEWVDPDTLEPVDTPGRPPAVDDDEDPSLVPLTEDPLVGRARVVVAYRTEDSKDWIIAWSRTITGSPDSVSQNFSTGTILTPGAHQIAVGVVPAAADPQQLNWAALTITSVPRITLASVPSISSTTTSAQHIASGYIRNETNGQRVRFVDCFTDGRLEIDMEPPFFVGGEGDVGPFYGQVLPSKGARWIELTPKADNVISGNVSWEFEYAERLRW